MSSNKRENNLKTNDFSQFLETLDPKVKESKLKKNAFVNILKKKMFQEKDLSELKNMVDVMDIDNDGFIDIFDLDTFLKRNAYIPKNSNENRKISHSTDISNKSSLQNERISLFPTRPLDENTMDSG